RGRGEIICALRPDRLLTRAAQNTIQSRDRKGAVLVHLKHLLSLLFRGALGSGFGEIQSRI
ncbi:MAG TPA: hypothetical protein VNY05_15210, partial [Candidatus Acidoferrales bacterium]|nr:hypothetical protein [Candidatus Acidoferrales bacterium]